MIRTRNLLLTALALMSFTNLSLADNRKAPPKTPSMPITGPFSVQMFAGGTRYVWLCVEPPKTNTDGTPIPMGKSVTIHVFQSMDGGKTYDRQLAIASGGRGHVGQGKPGSFEKKWIDLTVEATADNQPPYVIYLAATVTVDGVTSLGETANLTFRYWPNLVRYADRSEAPGANTAVPQRRQGFNICGDWYLQPGNIHLQIRPDGNKYVGTIRVGDESLTMVGTEANGVFDFSWTLRGNQTQLDGTVRLRPAADGRSIQGALRINGDNKSYPINLLVDGRNLRTTN